MTLYCCFSAEHATLRLRLHGQIFPSNSFTLYTRTCFKHEVDLYPTVDTSNVFDNVLDNKICG